MLPTSTPALAAAPPTVIVATTALPSPLSPRAKPIGPASNEAVYGEPYETTAPPDAEEEEEEDEGANEEDDCVSAEPAVRRRDKVVVFNRASSKAVATAKGVTLA